MIESEAPLCLPPRSMSGLVVKLPNGTADSHFHVFNADAPLVTPRSYTPRIMTLDDWRTYADLAGIERGVLVQPSVYGLDNRVLLTALTGDADRLRGVVVIPPDTSTTELQRLDRLGVRAVRINLRNKAGIGLDALENLAPRIRPLGWHVQFQVGPEAIAAVAELAQKHDINGVIDHLAFMPLDPVGPALDDMLRALDGGRIHVKISAPYRMRDTANSDGYRVAVAALAASHAHRLLWASDWPHTELFDSMVDDVSLLALSLEAVPASAHDLVFLRNAVPLYWSH